MEYFYPKGSPLKGMLDNIIEYYIKSKKYLHLLKKIYGNDIVKYYKEVNTNTDSYNND